ncbi:MAG: thioredoxin family protein [Flavobacteriaceae bacterium]|nr:thioredoxin family protein [Flavobacteriaceae bacterium]
MDKILVLAILSGVIAACNSTVGNKTHEKTIPATEIEMQNEKNEFTEIETPDGIMLLGKINRKALDNPQFNWYQQEADFHQLNTELINSFKKDLKDFEVEIFMGTWCSDSHRDVPAFFKIAQAADYPESKIKMYALDENKNSPSGIEKDRNVYYVPTFIFLKDGNEMGRIVESPINSLEEDIRDIVAGHPQTPNYAQ